MEKNIRRIFSLLISLIMISSVLSLWVFAAEEHVHIDEIKDGYCDICHTALEALTTVYAEKDVTETFKAGTLVIEDNLKDIILSQSADAAGFLYKNGEPVKETDIVPYGLEIMEIYAILEYEAEGPTCEDYGHGAYYFNALDGYYYEDASCTKCIGTDDDLRWWLSSLELGGTAMPLGHIMSICDDVNKGHICAREGCEYNKKPGLHMISDDDTCCTECGALCFKGCPHDPTCSDFYDFCNIFKNDGKPLEYTSYYVDKDVTLTEPLIINSPYVSILIADGVTFNAQKGYHFSEGGTLDVYYQSKGESKGSFIGTEYKCYDESTGACFIDHIDSEPDFICDVCKKSACTHNNIVCSYKWSDDYSECAGKAVCDDCKKVLSEEKGTVEFYETKWGNCVTKGSGHYAAYFEHYIDYTMTEEIETTYGPHSYYSYSSSCKNCYREDLMGARMKYNSRIDKLEMLTDDPQALEMLSQLRQTVNTAQHVGDITDAIDEYYGDFEELLNNLSVIMDKEDFESNFKNYARTTRYEKAAIDYLSEIKPMIDSTSDEGEISNIFDNVYDYVRELEKLKDQRIGDFIPKYLDPDTTDLQKSAIMAVMYDLLTAVHTEDVEKIYSGAEERIALAELIPAKLDAKKAIDAAAGTEQSEAMQKIVADAKIAVDGAKTAEEVEKAKQNALSKIEAQKQTEKPTEPTDEPCPKCGGIHGKDLIGQLTCLFNSILRFLKNLFVLIRM